MAAGFSFSLQYTQKYTHCVKNSRPVWITPAGRLDLCHVAQDLLQMFVQYFILNTIDFSRTRCYNEYIKNKGDATMTTLVKAILDDEQIMSDLERDNWDVMIGSESEEAIMYAIDSRILDIHNKMQATINSVDSVSGTEALELALDYTAITKVLAAQRNYFLMYYNSPAITFAEQLRETLDNDNLRTWVQIVR